MLCEKCHINQATTHVKQNINGKVSEMHLCSACAAGLSVNSMFGGGLFGSQASILGSLFGNQISGNRQESQVCPNCGTQLHEISASGRMGCAECYRVFRSYLQPSIRRIHGTAQHAGKIPANKENELTAEQKLKSLREQMEEAIERQDFEQAALLRDQIREAEGKGE